MKEKGFGKTNNDKSLIRTFRSSNFSLPSPSLSISSKKRRPEGYVDGEWISVERREEFSGLHRNLEGIGVAEC